MILEKADSALLKNIGQCLETLLVSWGRKCYWNPVGTCQGHCYDAQDRPPAQRVSWPQMPIVQRWETLAWTHCLFGAARCCLSTFIIYVLCISANPGIKNKFLINYLVSLRQTSWVNVHEGWSLSFSSFQNMSFLGSFKGDQCDFFLLRNIEKLENIEVLNVFQPLQWLLSHLWTCGAYLGGFLSLSVTPLSSLEVCLNFTMTSSSRVILSIYSPQLESATSPRSPGSLQRYLATTIWVLEGLVHVKT